MVEVEREVSSEMEGCEVESKVHDGIIPDAVLETKMCHGRR